jgi:hypothetical protein
VDGSFEQSNEPSGSKNTGKFQSCCTTGSLPRRAQLLEVSLDIVALLTVDKFLD